MTSDNRCDGRRLRDMLATSAAFVEREAAAINALNVFPVPDGDTGTNMLLTLRSTLDAVGADDTSAGSVAKAMAYGALMGARGNSGVILSQILRGIAEVLEKVPAFGGADLAHALTEGAATAYRGVSRPVEGTMLTVVREAATAAAAAAEEDACLEHVLAATVAAARESVARTPSLLAVLREAGVVDAGGQGLYVMLEGMLACLRGEALVATAAPAAAAAMVAAVPSAHAPAAGGGQVYGYCTELLIEGESLPLAEVRRHIESLGDSTLVVGDSRLIRIHVHTFDPGAVLSYGITMGTIRKVKVDNIDEQHQDFLVQRIGGAEMATLATLAVAGGDGLAQVFLTLGVSAVVPGGQTMNPSIQEILSAIEAVPASQVIVLPNNKNVIATAQQAAALTAKRVTVVPSRNVPQGVAAQIAFDGEATLEKNADAMTAALATVQTGEVTTAVRSGSLHGITFAAGDYIGLLEDELAAVGKTPMEVVMALLETMDAATKELLTLYYGLSVRPSAAQVMVAAIKRIYPELEVELVDGGQPHYDYILSLE